MIGVFGPGKVSGGHKIFSKENLRRPGKPTTARDLANDCPPEISRHRR
jgi:hypothetical protein